MFSGIIKSQGTVVEVHDNGANKSFKIKSDLTAAIHIDQSISHNGVCLTVEEINGDIYKVTAVKETLSKTNLGRLLSGNRVNLEHSITMQTLLDGHIVQGHIDTTGICLDKEEQEGSWLFTFEYPGKFRELLIEKGSVAVNGVSLTAFNCVNNQFSVAIIPYTYQHTNFSELEKASLVNIEFDLIGKYIQRSLNVNK